MKRTPLTPRTPLTFGSLFAGIGGFDLGFERAGMQCQWQVEIDEYANRVLEKHWPDVRRHGDIRTFPPEPADAWRVDVICGGFPCQDISYAGLGAGLEGERSGLFYEAMRAIGVLGPRYVVLENVAALLTRGLGEVLGTLESFGFDAEWHCVPAAAFGAPHFRDRVFVLARNTNSINDSPFGEGAGQWSEAAAGGSRSGEGSDKVSVADPASQRRKEGRQLRPHESEERAGGGCTAAHPDGSRLAERQGSEGKRPHAAASRSDWWLSEPDVGRVANGVPNRTHRLRGLGNAVVPQISQWIGERIVEHERENG